MYNQNKDKTTEKSSTILSFFKQVFDPKNNCDCDWAFATNLDLDHIMQTYVKRWRL